MKQKISVIIPNYNYARYIDQAIQSVLKQTYSNLELIVVNNGSTDDSLKVLEKYENQIILIDQANLGQSGARNSGLTLAKGELIAFLDADDFWEPNKLELQSQQINNSTQLVYCGVIQFKDPGIDNKQILVPKYRGDCSNHFIDLPGVSIVLSGESSALFSRDLLEKVGNFDAGLNSTAGWDFFRRCSRFTSFDFVNQPLVNYRLHSSNMSKSSAKVIEDMRLAYFKLFNDSEWMVLEEKKIEVLRKLEWSYFKTYLKSFDMKLAFLSGINSLKLLSKSF